MRIHKWPYHHPQGIVIFLVILCKDKQDNGVLHLDIMGNYDNVLIWVK